MKGISCKYFQPNDEYIELQSILRLVDNGSLVAWVILEFDAIGRVDLSDPRVLDFNKKVKEREQGLPIEWNELFSLSDWAGQIIWCTILGYQNLQHTLSRSPDFVIQMIDGCQWKIFSVNRLFLERLFCTAEDCLWIEESQKFSSVSPSKSAPLQNPSA